MYFLSAHGLSGIMPFEVSIIRNNWTPWKQPHLRVVQLSLVMDTLLRITPYVTRDPVLKGVTCCGGR